MTEHVHCKLIDAKARNKEFSGMKQGFVKL